MRAWSDDRVQRVIGTILRWGVVLAAATVLAGGAMYFASCGSTIPDYKVFRGEPPEMRVVTGIVREAVSLEPPGVDPVRAPVADRNPFGAGGLLRGRVRPAKGPHLCRGDPVRPRGGSAWPDAGGFEHRRAAGEVSTDVHHFRCRRDRPIREKRVPERIPSSHRGRERACLPGRVRLRRQAVYTLGIFSGERPRKPRMPYRSVSGWGGHPGMNRSTGKTAPTPFSTA